MESTAHLLRHPNWTIAGATLAWALVLALACAAAAASVLPAGFYDRPVAEGLNQPTAAALAPDGRLFVAEKAGRVRVVSAEGRLARQPLIDISAQVNSNWDRGLAGIAVDPVVQPGGSLRLYLLWVRKVDGAPVRGPAPTTVTRHVITGTTAGPPETILGTHGATACPPPGQSVDCIPTDVSVHVGGALHVDADSNLWVGTGDGVTPAHADPVALRAGSLDSLAGKILHVDPEGRGLPDHPFCPEETDLTKVCTKIYAKGFRNPFRASLAPGGLIVGDVGWDSWEELDLIEPGRDYGWPCREGGGGTPVYSRLSECAAADASSFTSPWFAYPHADVGSIVAGPAYDGGAYPAEIDGSVFFGDYAQRFIKRLSVDETGAITEHEFATDLSPVALVAAGNGDLLYVDLGEGGPNDGVVRRIVYSPGNAPPQARITAVPTAGGAPLATQFSAAASTDPDGDTLEYTWDFADGGSATGAQTTHEFAHGSYLVRLTARDPGGLEETATQWVDAGNSPPAVSLDAPATARVGIPLTLRATAQDDEDGNLPPHLAVVLIHAGHRHPMADGVGSELVFTPLQDHVTDSWYEATARVSDRHGRESVVRSRIDVGMVPPDAEDDEPVSEPEPTPAAQPLTSAKSRTRRPRLTWNVPARGDRKLSGTVADLPPGSRLQIAFARSGPKGCRWWRFDRGRHRRAQSPCLRARGWRRARISKGGTGRWTLPLGGPVRPGRLIVRGRAVAAGDAVPLLARRVRATRTRRGG